MAELHVGPGWVPPDTNVEEFEFAIRTVCEPIFEKPLAEISFGHVLLNLFNTARRFNMEVQPQPGVTPENPALCRRGRTPALSAARFMENSEAFPGSWIKDQVGIPALVRAFKEKAPFWVEKMPELPELVLRQFARGKNFQHSVDKIARELPVKSLAVRDNRVIFSELASLVLSGTFLLVNADLNGG